MNPDYIEINRRKRHVRRCWKKFSLFVINEIKKGYPAYNPDDLANSCKSFEEFNPIFDKLLKKLLWGGR